MGRSFSRASAANVPVTAAPFHHAASGAWFSIERRGRGFIHRSRRKEYSEDLEIHWVMGSGSRARTFLHRNARGELIELPLGWYAEKGGTFGMNPGFDSIAPPTRRKIDFDCMACHNAYPDAGANPAAAGAGARFLADPPQGIDCARCHGDGARHAMAAKGGAAREAIRSAIVNPARLPAARRDEVCAQCHLETTSARLPGMIRRFDRAPFAYRAGEPLSNAFFYFDHAPGSGREEKFEIVSAAYRMRQSACARAGGKFACVTCHDPHGRPRDSHTAPCLSCHPAAKLPAVDGHGGGARCASCHMPRRRTEDVVHVVMTDHKVQRRAAPGLLDERLERHPAESEEYRGEVVPYAPSSDPLPPEASLYAAVAQVLHESNLAAGIPRLEAELAGAARGPAEAWAVLGNAWRASRRPDKAVEAFAEAARREPDSVRRRRDLGVALLEHGRAEDAAAAFRRALGIDAGDAASIYQLALIDSGAGRIRDAVEKARRAVALDPDLIDARNSLGANLASLGDAAGAETAFRNALGVDPYSAVVHANLARLLGSRGGLDAAREHFEEAIRLRPLYAPDRYDYAVTLARANRPEEARAQAESAVSLAPGFVDARVLLGMLHSSGGRLEAARRELEAALRLRADHGRAHLELGRVLAATGDRAGAARHFEAAARDADPEAARMAREALDRVR